MIQTPLQLRFQLILSLVLMAVAVIIVPTSALEGYPSAGAAAAATAWDFPLTAEDAIIQRELEWAENAMETYHQKTGSMPLRSSIRAAHVFSEEWRRDAIVLLAQAAKAQEFEQELLARSNTNRYLRGTGNTATTTTTTAAASVGGR